MTSLYKVLKTDLFRRMKCLNVSKNYCSVPGGSITRESWPCLENSNLRSGLILAVIIHSL